jgi:hypothetical protein
MLFGEPNSWTRLLWGCVAMIGILALQYTFLLWIIKRGVKKA